jgi:hypothetical protein
MCAFTRLRFWRALRDRLCVTGVCLAYLLAALDIPLPAIVHKDSSQPFPCQDHPCGCQTAEQCWTHCCCFTPQERWAWARAHGVEPPAYAEKPTKKPVKEPTNQGWNTVKRRNREQEKTKSATKSCCRKRSECAACSKTSSKRPAKQAANTSNGVRWGSVLAAWQCQGFRTLWVSVGAVLPTPLRDEWSPDWSPPSLFTLADTHASVRCTPPPAPPPRQSLV